MTSILAKELLQDDTPSGPKKTKKEESKAEVLQEADLELDLLEDAPSRAS